MAAWKNKYVIPVTSFTCALFLCKTLGLFVNHTNHRPSEAYSSYMNQEHCEGKMFHTHTCSQADENYLDDSVFSSSLMIPEHEL